MILANQILRSKVRIPVNLQVQGSKDTLASNAIIQYRVGEGAWKNIGTISTTTCEFIGEEEVAVNDTIQVKLDTGESFKTTQDSSNCAAATGSYTTYTFVMPNVTTYDLAIFNEGTI